MKVRSEDQETNLLLNTRHPPLATLIDTHCHLEMEEFDQDRETVIQRATDNGIEAIITIGSDLEGNLGGLELAERYDLIYASVGIHPHDAKDFTEDIYLKLREWTSKEKVVAIGETGLDYHYDNSPREIQREVFRRHLLFAKEIGLPVVIHSRDAKKDTLEILSESGVNRGVLHCFSGDIDMAERAMSMGFYISIAGPVTFKNARRLREITKAIPDDYLLIETDAPYLTPEPLRGKRNEPSYLVHTAKVISEIRNITPDDMARITTLNARRLFRIGRIEEKGEIAYKIRDSLYLNITNRCTNSCSFCIRFQTDYVKGYNLRLLEEPTEEELKASIGDPSKYKEIVFCGYGEPLLRLDLVRSLSAWINENGGVVRINTNGHGNLIHRRNILPDLKGIVDRISISLDAHDEETYNRICKPLYRNAFKGVIEFIRESKKYIPDVEATVVELKGVDIEKCREIAGGLGVRLRVRKLNEVG
ncbi:MAG: TatD family hydrolase [Nitrospirota bacterium]